MLEGGWCRVTIVLYVLHNEVILMLGDGLVCAESMSTVPMIISLTTVQISTTIQMFIA